MDDYLLEADEESEEIVELKDVKMHHCDICTYSSKRKYDLKRHKRTRHGEKSQATAVCTEKGPHIYLCDQCGKTYTSQQGLKVHQNDKHLQQFRFCCSICKAGFNRLWDYHGHVTKHSKIRVEKCDECGKTFQYKQALKEHKKTQHPKQSQTVNFLCNICGEHLSCRNALREHMRAVHEGRKFCCTCGKSYSWRSSYHYHVKKCKS